MKSVKRITVLLLILTMLVSFCGCGNSAALPETTQAPTAPKPTAYRPPPLPPKTEPTEHPLKQEYKKDPTAFVSFSLGGTSYEYVPIEEMMEYESIYPDCHGTWFRDQLSEEDLCIYNALLYAMEHHRTWFEMYVEDNDKDFYYIRQSLSLDSPFLEQNKNDYGENISSQATNYRGERISFHVSQFIEKRLDMKLEALEKCRQIVRDMPAECKTQMEKAEYLYRYVCDNMEYVAYENMADNDYLYDAVIKGQSVCDGYSNMLNLLFNLAGIESYEAMGYNVKDFSTATEDELENAGGHTWVVAEIDGAYYNFDPTWEDTKQDQWPTDLVFFGFSDQLAPVKYIELDEQRPKCTDTSRDFAYADLVVDDVTSYSDVKKIAALVEERAAQSQYVTLIGVRNGVTDGSYSTFMRIFGNYNDQVIGLSATGRDFGTSSLLWLTAITEDQEATQPQETTQSQETAG